MALGIKTWKTNESTLLMANLEALTNPEETNPDPEKGDGKTPKDNNDDDKLDTSYSPSPYTCDMYVGAKGSMTIGGIVIKAGADGFIKIGGARDCTSGGSSTCEPITCTEVFGSVF